MKRISNSEWKVMEVIWSSAPRTALQVAEEVGETEGWNPQTVKTLLARLVRKEVLRYEKEGNRFLYYPAVERENAITEETESFLERVCRGSLAPILTHAVESRRRLDDDELEALRQLLRNNETKDSK